jgi:quercetin dioxygenase-like cupin family protein
MAPDRRVRQAPSERLAGAVARLDLRAAAAELRAEPADGAHPTHGHRQTVLARHGATTVALFVFEAGASLPPHTARGTVCLQTIEGEIRVTVEGKEQRLGAGSLLVLAPGALHGVRADAPSVMLLTVSLER